MIARSWGFKSPFGHLNTLQPRLFFSFHNFLYYDTLFVKYIGDQIEHTFGLLLFSSYHYNMKSEMTIKQNDESHKQFRSLSAYLQTAREEERKSIAREIHNELGQALTTIKLELSLLQEEVLQDASAATDCIQSMKERVDETIYTVKSIITKLRPGLLDDLGLTAAVEWQANDF